MRGAAAGDFLREWFTYRNVPVRACPALLLLARESGRAGRGESCARRVPLTLEVEPRPGWMLIERRRVPCSVLIELTFEGKSARQLKVRMLYIL